MLGVLALILISQTSTTAADFRPLRVVLLPTYGKPVERGASVLDARLVRAFTEELHAEARRTFQWRRWSVPTEAAVDKAVAEWGGRSKCIDARCYDGLAVKLEASHWLAARLVEAPKKRCFATVVLEDLQEGSRDFRAERKIEPCNIDNAVLVARELGREVSAGPRAPVRVTHSFTDLGAPSIEVPSIPSIEALPTATSTTPQRKKERELGLDQALSIYKKRHLIAFNQEIDDGEWHTLVARDGKLVDECSIRRAAGYPVDDELETFCKGNNWEWAWLGVPVGGVVAIGSFRGLRQGSAPGVLGFVFGTIASIVSASLALALNVDAADPAQGEYLSHWRLLEQMVTDGNERLRTQLELSAAEVEAAGMRR